MFYSLEIPYVEDEYGKQLGKVWFNGEFYKRIGFHSKAMGITTLICELEDSGRLNDVLCKGSISADGFLISEKVKLILESYRLCKSSFYSVDLCFKKEKYRYWFFHIYDNLINELDFSKVFFEIRDSFFDDVVHSEKKFLDYEDFRNFRKQNKDEFHDYITPRYIFKNNPRFDLFQIGVIDDKVYLTNELVEVMKREKVTGILFNEADLF